MSWARRIFRKLQSSDGRIKLATLLGGSVLVAVLALLAGVLPAFAGNGDPSGLGVQPVELGYGGGAGACDAEFPGLPSAASYELHINNPIAGIYTGPDPDGTQVEIFDVVDDETFGFRFLNDSNPVTMAAFDVVVNGGSQNTHYDYDGSGGPGPVQADTLLHAPTKGGSSNLFRLSHVNICYDVFVANVTGIKYHDRDTDGDFDTTEEEGLAGWTITAFGTDVTVTTETGADGSYTLGNLGVGTFTICEATNTEGLPTDGDGFEWTWTQSEPESSALPHADCTDFDGYEPNGYSIELADDEQLIENIDFGNHTQVAIDCSAGNVVVILGGSGTDDNPLVTITIPQDAPSCSGGNVWTTTFDVGRSDPDGGDSDFWTQFFVFGGLPTDDAVVVDIVSVWDAEEADYVEQDLDGGPCDAGDLCTTVLQVPTTLVQLDPGGIFQPAPLVLCNTLTDGLPNVVMPYCLDSRTIAEGGDLPSGYIQLTEKNLLLGDPSSFR